ncbi:MAG TPA: multicopper oxidase domain-containing protein [Candidatus Limnocylindria bacterium]|nr:multicopper oxidase domain-containing protein [Candidatus Limnocylindria bacterium]
MPNMRGRIRIGSVLWAVTLAVLGKMPVALGQSSSSAMIAPTQHDSSHAAAPFYGSEIQTAEKAPIQNAVDIVRDPADVAPPPGKREPQVVKVSLVAQELEGKLDAILGATYEYWTFNGKVPGPMIRVRQGDTIELTLKNEGRLVSHSIDLHAALGPGRGMDLTEAKQGETRSFTFKAIVPGVFVYHCGTNLAAQHISNGMYGLIVVEPPEGLPAVDHEFYVMQGEIYTVDDIGGMGHQKASLPKLMDERPEYFVFNGAVDSLTTQHPMHARTGETVRIFFGVGGPNLISSPHVIGQVLTLVYNEGSFTSPPLTSVQTTVVPPGGATVIEIKPLVPGSYKLVDHALVRVARGLVGVIEVSGPPRPELFHEGPAQ